MNQLFQSMQLLCKYKLCCRPGPPTRQIKLQNEQGGAVPGCVSSLSLAKRGFEPARSVSLHQLGNPGSSRELSNLLFSSIFFYNAWENRSHWAQTLGECRKGNNLKIIVQVYIKDFPSSSLTFLIQRFCRTRVSFWLCRPFIKARRKPWDPRVAKKMSGCKWGWSEHNLQLQLSKRLVYFYHDILQ